MAEPIKTLLLILDGWGIGPKSEGNCVRNAVTPYLDGLLVKYPHTSLACSGRAVGQIGRASCRERVCPYV